MTAVIHRVDTSPHSVETPTPLADSCDLPGFVELAVPAGDMAPSPDQKASTHLQLQQIGGENGPGRHRPARGGNPNQGTPLAIGWGS